MVFQTRAPSLLYISAQGARNAQHDLRILPCSLLRKLKHNISIATPEACQDVKSTITWPLRYQTINNERFWLSNQPLGAPRPQHGTSISRHVATFHLLNWSIAHI
jgi:hypothetical protein